MSFMAPRHTSWWVGHGEWNGCGQMWMGVVILTISGTILPTIDFCKASELFFCIHIYEEGKKRREGRREEGERGKNHSLKPARK